MDERKEQVGQLVKSRIDRGGYHIAHLPADWFEHSTEPRVSKLIDLSKEIVGMLEPTEEIDVAWVAIHPVISIAKILKLIEDFENSGLSHQDAYDDLIDSIKAILQQ